MALTISLNSLLFSKATFSNHLPIQRPPKKTKALIDYFGSASHSEIYLLSTYKHNYSNRVWRKILKHEIMY